MIPRLIHPVNIQIQVLDRSSTFYDDEMREPIQQSVRGSTVTVPGQVKWGSDQAGISRREGTEESSDGYVLFRLVDLAANGVTLKREDRFIKLGTIETDVYVQRLEYTGHYSDQGGPTMVKAHFVDAQPSRQTKGS